jgi:hypothetical protein
MLSWQQATDQNGSLLGGRVYDVRERQSCLASAGTGECEIRKIISIAGWVEH